MKVGDKIVCEQFLGKTVSVKCVIIGPYLKGMWMVKLLHKEIVWDLKEGSEIYLLEKDFKLDIDGEEW